MSIHLARLTSPLFLVTLLTLALTSCGGGGGGSKNKDPNPGDSGNTPQDTKATDSQAIDNSPLTQGGTFRFSSSNSESDGALLSIPPGAVNQDADISLTTADTTPTESPWGQSPIGSLFEIGPSGTNFSSDNKALLTLPVPPGALGHPSYIGRWNPTSETWDSLGGIVEGDFISTQIDHLSL